MGAHSAGTFPTLGPADRCPCSSGEEYGACCGRFHTGAAAAPTAEALMRSRYSAFVVGDAGYLLRTWHPHTRPLTLDLDPAQRWLFLEIIGTSRGGWLDTEGTVEFRAHYRHGRTTHRQQEASRFIREDGHWLYLDALADA